MKRLLFILLSALSLTAVAQEDIKRVAILETVDKLGTVPYLKQLMFRSNLTTAITNTDGYEGYDRTDLKEILGEKNFKRTGLVSDKDIKKIGEFTGAQYVLIAEATIDGTDMFITAKIIDVETARVIRNSNQLMGTSAADMQEGSQKVASDLLGATKINNNTVPNSRNNSQKNSWNVPGRSVRYLPQPTNYFRQEGTVIVRIFVNKNGKVVSVMPDGGSITDQQTVQSALDAAQKAQFSGGDSTVEGTIVYLFRYN